MITNGRTKLFLAIMLLATSCSWSLGVKKLGNRIYWDDKIIVVTKIDKYEGVGLCIIPPNIEKVKKDEKFVIVQTLNGKNQIRYWLIDKTIEGKQQSFVKEDSSYWSYYKSSNVYGPLDSTEFSNLKTRKGVNIKW
jgi:hypothetical protein